MITQRDHLYLNNDHQEIFLVRKILEKYGFTMDVSKPDENNVVSCNISGKNDKQDLSTLTQIIIVILDIIYNPERVITHPITGSKFTALQKKARNIFETHYFDRKPFDDDLAL
jgi:hypothetical protein